MKLALIVALCTVAAVASYNPSYSAGDFSVFKPGVEYIYHYKGHVLSGIPKTTEQFSGLLIDSLVIFQFQQDYKVVMKMDKIKLYKINNKISTLPSEPIPEGELTRLTGEQASIITEHLVKPVKCRYEEGEVRDLEKEMSDRYWSVNIKKGLLSLFQVTLKEKSTYNTEPSTSYYSDPVMVRQKNPSSYNSRSYTPVVPYWKLTTKSNSVYKVMETDVTGNCESEYTLISDKTHLSSSSSKMMVTVVRNYENCLNKPFHIQGLFQGVHRNQHEKDLIQPMVHTDYVIKGDRSHFLIEKATLRGKYMFLVNGLEGGDLSTYVYQHLTLTTTQPIRSPVHLTSPKVDHRGLLMVLPKATLLPEKKSFEEVPTYTGRRSSRYQSQEKFIKPSYENELYEEEEEREIYSTDSSDVISAVDMRLNELVECLYPTTTEKKCSEILYEVSRIVRELNRSQLKTLYTRFVRSETPNSGMEYRKSEILLDILPTLPNPEAAKVLLELIKEKRVGELRGSLMVKAMTLVIKPTPSVIKSTLELFKELTKERISTISSKTMLRQSLLLGVGTLTHRLINVMRAQGKPIPEVISFIDSISSELKRMLEETTTEPEKILLLKSLGNMGASETIMTLKSFLEDPRQTPTVRIHSVFALRRLAKQFSKQVNPILLSIFMDVKEIREVRQAAFVVLINSNPSYPTLQMMAHRIRHEPSSQIRTLVYSSLVNLAMYKSHEPEHKTLIKNARLILKTLPPVHIGVHDSISVFLNQFSEDLDLGGAFNLIKIKSKMSGLPEALIGNIQGTLFGKHRRLLEVGAEGKSLEVILRKFFGPHGLFKQILKGQVSLRDILKPLTRPDMGQVESKIRELINRMMTESRSEFEPFGSLYIHILGNELQYIMLNSENIEEVINKVTTVIPELLLKLTRGYKVDIVKSLSHIASVTIPSPIGIPLSLNYTTMAMLKVEGHIKVNNLPAWSDMVSSRFSSFPISKLGLEVDLKPFVDMSHYITMGANMRWLASGVSTDIYGKIRVPVKLTAHIDPIQQSISVKYFTPKETVKAVYFEAKPLTFIKHFPTNVNRLPFVIEVKEIKSEHIVKQIPFNYKYQCSFSGHEVDVQGLTSLCGPTWCPIVPLYGKQQITVISRPVNNVDFIHLKIKSVRSNLEFEGIPSSLRPEELFEKEQEDIEEEERLYNVHSGYRRPVSRSLIESGEFEPIPVDRIFETSEPIKRQLLITLGPNTMQTPTLKTLVTWLMSRQYWKNQLNVQAIRMGYEEMPSWKIHLNNVINPLTWYPEESYKGEFLNKLSLLWNINGEVNEIKAKIVPGSPFDFSRELKEHSVFPLLPHQLSETNTKKYKYTLEVDTPKMTHKMMKYITVAHDLIKYAFFTKLYTTIPTQPLEDKIIVSVELMPWWEKMNVIVKTPRENSYISSVPFYWNPFHPTSEKMTLHDLPSWKWYKNTTDEEYFFDTVPYKTTPILSGTCTITPEELNTFDGVSIPMQTIKNEWNNNCEVTIAQHCTSDGLFSMVVKGSNDVWAIKMLMPKYEFTIQSLNRKLTMLINGEEKSLPLNQPVIIREEYSEISPKLYKIEKLETGIVELKAYELGITVTVDTNELMTAIKMSPFSVLQGQLCGLCGNFNQDPSDDLYTISDFQPENRDYLSLFRKNVLNPETCSTESLRTVSNDYCLKEKHITINRYDNDTPMTCTTERKMPVCLPGCRPEETKSVKTCFTCRGEEGVSLPRKTFIPNRWDSFESSGIDCEDFYQRVEIPTRCVPVY